MKVKPLNQHAFGACVTDLDLALIDAETLDAVYQELLRYGLLVFPQQNLDEANQAAFGEKLGTLEFGGLLLANQVKQEGGSFSDVLPTSSHRMKTNIGNEAWHTDSTYWPISSKCALLSAVRVPAVGGETEFADMRAAYAALTPETQQKIAGLSAYH